MYRGIIYVKIFNSIDSNVIIWFFFNPYLKSTSKSLIPSPVKPHVCTSPNKPAHTHTLTQYAIQHLTLVYCINHRLEINFFMFISSDYSLITYLHIFVHESVHISLPFHSIVHIHLIIHILYLLYIYLGPDLWF